ncbi:hypothetical protein N9383_04830 [Granulosicoccus sp.]|nr:hypothetical protein [Granulosicoccus sp.]
MKITTEENVFSVIAPALDARELVNLKQWFKCLSERKLPRFACNPFTELNLEFEFLASNDTSVRIAIGLRLEIKPDFELVQLGRKSKDWRLVSESNSEQFSNILLGFDKAIDNYPIRSGKPEY